MSFFSKDNISSVTKQYSVVDASEVACYIVQTNDGNEYAVPLVTANTDYQAIQEWIADGGTVIDNPPEETP